MCPHDTQHLTTPGNGGGGAGRGGGCEVGWWGAAGVSSKPLLWGRRNDSHNAPGPRCFSSDEANLQEAGWPRLCGRRAFEHCERKLKDMDVILKECFCWEFFFLLLFFFTVILVCGGLFQKLLSGVHHKGNAKRETEEAGWA